MSAEIIRIDEALQRAAERQALVRDYVTEQLDGESAEAFELRMMENPDLMDEVEVEDKLRTGMKSLTSAESMHAESSTAPRNRHTSRRWANVAAGFVCGALSLYLLQPAWVGTPSAPSGAAQMIEVSAMRGAASEDVNALQVVANADAAYLVVQWPLPRTFDELRAEVSRSSDTEITTVSADETASTATVVVALTENWPKRVELHCRSATQWQRCDRPIAVAAR